MKTLLKNLWFRLPYNLSIPAPLPYKIAGTRPWIPAHPDETGIAIAQRWPFPNYNYENRLWDFIQKLEFKPRKVAIDAGAGQGFYTLMLADKFETVLAVEPNPIEAEILHNNLDKYGVKNTVILKQPLSSRIETVDFRWIQHHESRSSFAPVFQEDVVKFKRGNNKKRKVQLETTTLDIILDGMNWIEDVAFIKLDIEGAELEALSGMKRTILINRPIIVCELADIATDSFNYWASEIISRLTSYGYKGFTFDSNRKLQSLDEHVGPLRTEGIFLPND
ncbi:hypothetical protein LCGC14_0422310 [marine sediment metagenome]|uniref:Methyltransferase FkbM domain-containing protein n=1 Tax=marine sediment metagenome TaxID=412755 RepID=A0A0F9VCN7_9ZZZZ